MLTPDQLEHLHALEEECDFYSNNGEDAREQWIAEEFLKNLNEDYKTDKFLLLIHW